MKYGHSELHIEELLKEKGISKNTMCSYLDCGIEELIEYVKE